MQEELNCFCRTLSLTIYHVWNKTFVSRCFTLNLIVTNLLVKITSINKIVLFELFSKFLKNRDKLTINRDTGHGVKSRNKMLFMKMFMNNNNNHKLFVMIRCNLLLFLTAVLFNNIRLIGVEMFVFIFFYLSFIFRIHQKNNFHKTKTKTMKLITN